MPAKKKSSTKCTPKKRGAQPRNKMRTSRKKLKPGGAKGKY
tara:strand:- start:6736 stop:6858 length:123 start_codon:yes stop_codon:yes gene_type:complete